MKKKPAKEIESVELRKQDARIKEIIASEQKVVDDRNSKLSKEELQRREEIAKRNRERNPEFADFVDAIRAFSPDSKVLFFNESQASPE